MSDVGENYPGGVNVDVNLAGESNIRKGDTTVPNVESIGLGEPLNAEDLGDGDAEDVVPGGVDDPEESVQHPMPPAVGMTFSTMDEVEAFYKKYAKSRGFAVVRVGGSSNNAKERISMVWRCECYGSPDMKRESKSTRVAKNPVEENLNDKELCNPRRRKSKKCNCTAKVYASMNECRSWVVRDVVLHHLNHDPKPVDAKLVKAYRMEEFTASDERRLKNAVACGQSVSTVLTTMAHERGGYENVPFNQCDMRHVVNKDRKAKMSGGDFNALLSYFGKLQRDNPNFYYVHRVDAEGHMKDILWVDARSRAAYAEFSDVVCFDTTYLTNQYSLPFANFVGVNHHGQSILFGCALITNEDSETFEWVFREWLLCMKGKAPGGILTDQAAAMRRPLEVVMPHTRHRWCIWHITQKFPYRFGNHKSYKALKDDLLHVVYNSLSEEAFEAGWNAVVVKYGIEKDEWLQNLFDQRHMWVPAFMSDYFWAGMRSTQRVESINSFFDKFVDRNTMLCEFGEKYIAAVEKRIWEENEADHKDVKFHRNYSTGFSVERFFKKIYTSTMFRHIQRECEKRTYCFIDEVKKVDENNVEYLMEDRVWVKRKKKAYDILTEDRTHYLISYNTETKEGKCQCKKFETDGIICRHLITIFYKVRIDDIPEKYVLRRWRKDVVRMHSSVTVSYHDLARTEQVKRHIRLVVAFEPISQLASQNEQCTLIMLNGMERTEAEIRGVLDEQRAAAEATQEGESNIFSENNDSIAENQSEIGVSSSAYNSQCSGTVPSATSGSSQQAKDPILPRKRGRPRGSRYKAISETGWSLKPTPATPSCSCSCAANGKAEAKKKGRGKGRKGKKQNADVGDPLEALDDETNTPAKRRKRVSFAGEEVAPSARTDLNTNVTDFHDAEQAIDLD